MEKKTGPDSFARSHLSSLFFWVAILAVTSNYSGDELLYLKSNIASLFIIYIFDKTNNSL